MATDHAQERMSAREAAVVKTIEDCIRNTEAAVKVRNACRSLLCETCSNAMKNEVCVN